MANVYDGGFADSSMTSAAPPRAPLPLGVRSRMRSMLAGRAKANMKPQVSVHPNHPIFQRVSPAFANFLAQRIKGNTPPIPPMPPAPVPDPASTGQTASGTSTTTPPGAPPAESPYPWMNIPTDLSGLGAEQWGPAPSGSMDQGSDPREALMQRMSRLMTPHPQEPMLTNAHSVGSALRRHLAGRMAQRRPNVLPNRRPLNRPY